MNSKLVKQLLLMTLLPLSLCLHTPAFAAGLPPAIDGQPLPSLAPMLERSTPAVVNISTSTNIEIRENPLMQDPFFRQFFQIPNMPRHQQRNSLGSGVIIDSQQGLVLTNNHVIAKADKIKVTLQDVIAKADKIKVTLQDGRQLAAQLVGADAEADIAIIKIPAQNLTQIPIADSSRLRVGDFVVAIGNPFGLGQSVTSGIVSALGRSGLGIEGYEDFIQTDASSNRCVD
ncbi:MAG: serine protease Do [Methylococcaceae bacterium NSP1-2]|nr:MAG: serine protease Do [Methylococcaceae bacterium NSP1-2]